MVAKDPEEGQAKPLWGRQICSALEQRKEHLETIIPRKKREMRYSGQLQRKLTSELVYIYVKKNLAKEFEERNFKMTGIK